MARDHLHHGRQSIRLRGHDYAQCGAYFVTICTRDHTCLFGEVVSGEMRLNDIGRIVHAFWNGLPNYCPGVETDAFVVMPDHVHGIIVIADGGQRDAAPEISVGLTVRAIRESPLPGSHMGLSPLIPCDDFVARRRRMLIPKIVGRFKMTSAKQINRLRITPGVPVWQRNYYEHIIRDDASLDEIRRYIEENPAHWSQAIENSMAEEG